MGHFIGTDLCVMITFMLTNMQPDGLLGTLYSALSAAGASFVHLMYLLQFTGNSVELAIALT